MTVLKFNLSARIEGGNDFGQKARANRFDQICRWAQNVISKWWEVRLTA